MSLAKDAPTALVSATIGLSSSHLCTVSFSEDIAYDVQRLDVSFAFRWDSSPPHRWASAPYTVMRLTSDLPVIDVTVETLNSALFGTMEAHLRLTTSVSAQLWLSASENSPASSLGPLYFVLSSAVVPYSELTICLSILPEFGELTHRTPSRSRWSAAISSLSFRICASICSLSVSFAPPPDPPCAPFPSPTPLASVVSCVSAEAGGVAG